MPQLAGITAQTPDPADGRIERDPDGVPAGTLHEGAMQLVERLLPPTTPAEQRSGLLAAQDHLFSSGITAWQDAAVGAMFGQDDLLPVYVAAAADVTVSFGPPNLTPVVGDWRVEFVSGGPTLPPAFTTATPGSWTKSGGDAETFSGTARYSVSFESPALPGKPVWLDLGRVSQSARVKLNGRDYGRLIAPPFRVLVNNLKPGGNTLEVEVTSTSANAIRYYDRAGVVWKNFHDINFVNQDYKPFNAANWPVTDEGLLGPVTLSAAGPLNLLGGIK